MTIREAIANAITTLSGIYTNGEAEAISSWLVENLTGIRRIERAGNTTILNDQQQTRLFALLERLLQHEPIQYVLNESWFLGFKFYVDKRVLIPRPETEELVEWIITDCKFPIDQLSILDIGTGSGCIPVSLKRRLGKAEVTSVDISVDALEVAKKNAKDLGVSVQFHELDFLDPGARGTLGKYDVIVSNPPYIPVLDKTGMHQNVLNYEPPLALFVPDEDPLIFYKALAEFGVTHLADGGAIYMELYETHGHATAQLFQEKGYKIFLKPDMQGKDRMLRAGR